MARRFTVLESFQDMQGVSRRFSGLSLKGFTLAELLMSVLVIAVVGGGLLACFVYNLYLIETAGNTAVANWDLRNMVEKIWNTPFDHTTGRFPDNVADGGTNDYSALIGGYRLRGERLTVTYADVNADPLEIKVTITYQDKDGRGYTASLVTFRTR